MSRKGNCYDNAEAVMGYNKKTEKVHPLNKLMEKTNAL